MKDCAFIVNTLDSLLSYLPENFPREQLPQPGEVVDIRLRGDYSPDLVWRIARGTQIQETVMSPSPLPLNLVLQSYKGSWIKITQRRGEYWMFASCPTVLALVFSLLPDANPL